MRTAPRGSYPGNMLKWVGGRLERLAAEKPVLLAFLVLVAATIVVIPASLPFYVDDTHGFVENIMAEAHGTLFDLLIIGWFLLWLNKRAETRLTNNRYREEIEDYLGWKSPEATHRIAGNIRRLNRGGVKEKFRLTHAYLKGANLANASLRESDLWGADAEGAALGGANLHGCNMAGANLEGADLERANLIEADLRGANLREADLERATISRADLRGATLIGVDLQYAILTFAHLERAHVGDKNEPGLRANLREANLQGANLRRADLTGANMQGVNLRGADLSDTIFDDVDLERANLIGAKFANDEAPAMVFKKVRSLRKTRFDPDVAERLMVLYPELFHWVSDSEEVH